MGSAHSLLLPHGTIKSSAGRCVRPAVRCDTSQISGEGTFSIQQSSREKQCHCPCEDRWVVARHFPFFDLLCVFPVATGLEVTHPRQSGYWAGTAGLGRTCGHLVLALTPSAPWERLLLARLLGTNCALPQAVPGLCMFYSPSHPISSFTNSATSAKSKLYGQGN